MATQTEETIKELFKVGAHYGYSKSTRHPSVRSYIFGNKNGVEIFDLEKTAPLLEDVKEFVRELARSRKKLLFVSSKPEACSAIRSGAESIGQPYVIDRWIGGTLTNFDSIRKRVEKMQDWKKKSERGDLEKFTKKEQLLLSREAEKLENKFGGIVDMEKMPGALFVIDSKHESIALAEAKKKKIKVIALLNTDCNVKEVDLALFGNDNSRKSIEYFVNEIVEAYREGFAQAPEKKVEKVGDKSQTKSEVDQTNEVGSREKKPTAQNPVKSLREKTTS